MNWWKIGIGILSATAGVVIGLGAYRTSSNHLTTLKQGWFE